MIAVRRAAAAALFALVSSLIIGLMADSALAQEVIVLCNYEVDWCEAMKAAYEKTTGEKAAFIRRTDGESLAQIRAEKANPRADIYHAAESASAKTLAGLPVMRPANSARCCGLVLDSPPLKRISILRMWLRHLRSSISLLRA